MLNHQLWIANNGWSSSLGVSQEATTLHTRKTERKKEIKKDRGREEGRN
jgi:hypothetical protein